MNFKDFIFGIFIPSFVFFLKSKGLCFSGAFYECKEKKLVIFLKSISKENRTTFIEIEKEELEKAFSSFINQDSN